jgi:hypothetical protein
LLACHVFNTAPGTKHGEQFVEAMLHFKDSGAHIKLDHVYPGPAGYPPTQQAIEDLFKLQD